MTNEELVVPAFAEWEMLREPLCPYRLLGRPIFESERFPQWVDKMTVSRTENYGIEAVFEGPAPLIPNQRFPAPPNPLVLRFADALGAIYELTGRVAKHTSSTEPGPEGRYFTRICTHMQVQQVVIQDRPAHETVRLTDWFLNGPKTSFLYPGHTKRELRVERIRHREGLRAGIDRFERPFPERGEFTGDFVFVRYRTRSLLLHAVPQQAGVAWSNCVGIEYRIGWGGIPGETEREAIADIIGFVLGRRLLLIARTEVGEDQLPTRRSAMPPNTIHAETLCRMNDRPPVQVVHNTNGRVTSRLQRVLEQLVPRYLEQVDDYNLGGALYRHATAREVPLGIDLPLLQSAVEMISKGWRQTQKGRGLADPGCYMRKKDFDRTFSDEMTSAAGKLSTASVRQLLTRRRYGPRLVRKMEHSYEMTGNELLDLFFDGIRLPLGKTERDAMHARNTAIHGSTIPVGEMAVWAARSDAYYSLVNRVILRVLGYRGRYFDYTSLIGAERPLREPASGPQAFQQPEGSN